MIISKGDFIKLIEEFQEFTKLFDKFHDLKVDLIDSDLHEYPCKLFDKLVNLHFNEVGRDWIDYYLYEVPLLKSNKAYVEDEKGKEIPLKSADDLWELVKDERI